MSDSAPAQITFYAIDPADTAAIIEWLNDWYLGPDWEPTSDNTEVQAHQSYGDPDAGLGIMLDGAVTLERVAPGSTWKLTQDAKYEFDGEHHHYAPSLGRWCGRSTQDGEPTFTRDEVMAAAGSNWDLDYLTGGPWLRAIDALRPDSEKSQR